MRAASREMIDRLVAMDTTSRTSNLTLIRFVRDQLATLGVESQLIPNAEGTKANLFATIGPAVEGGVILSGHTDVVPVDGQSWTTNPWVATEKHGRLYGRGTCDMKAFCAIAMGLAPEFLARDLKRPIHLALSYDEEVGCLGAPSMIERIVAEGPKPSAVIVGEPTGMKPVTAHKGVTAIRVTVTGREAHSSQPHRGVSAVMTAARLVSFIEAMMACERAGADPGAGFDPAFTTLHVGTINGGSAVNIISRQCVFMWDIRALPGDDWRTYLNRFEAYCDGLRPAMRTVCDTAGVACEVVAAVPPLREEPGGEAARLACALTGRNRGLKVSYGAEAGQFQEAGLSAVMCGPGSIDQAHQPDEFIEISQVEACEAFLLNLADRLAV